MPAKAGIQALGPRFRGDERSSGRTIVYPLYRAPSRACGPSPNLLKIQIELEPPRRPAVNPVPYPAVNRKTPVRD
jgi:hypothetical protein